MNTRTPVWKDSEAVLLEQIRELARHAGWRTYHTLRSTGSEAGFPDLVLIREQAGGADLLFVELKTGRGALTEKQTEWLALLGSVPGIEIAVWRPADWLQIVERLTRPRRTITTSRGPHAPHSP